MAKYGIIVILWHQILFDFKLRYKENHNNFLSKWPQSAEHIAEIYEELRGGSLNDFQIFKDWLPSIKKFCMLINLLPTIVGRIPSSQIAWDKFPSILEKFITFEKENFTIDEHLTTNANKHPYLILAGNNKTIISNYFLCVERNVIPLEVQSIVEACDYLFKAHYVFNQTFHLLLKAFYSFLIHYFYNIPNCESVTLRVNEVASKFNAALHKHRFKEV